MSADDFFGLLSGIFWTACYIGVIHRGWKDRTYAMPMAAMIINITWEFLFTFVYPSVGGTMQEVINIVWFAFDLGIVYLYLRFWRTDRIMKMPDSWFWPVFLGTFALAAPMLIATVAVFGQDDGSVYTAFGDNLIMSVLFLTMLLRRGDRRGQSMWIAWTKCLGTAAASISNYIENQSNALWNVMFVEIFLLDVLYIVLLARAPKYVPEEETDDSGAGTDGGTDDADALAVTENAPTAVAPATA